MSPSDTRLPHEKGFHVSWDQLHRDSRALAWRLDRKGPGPEGQWRGVVAVTRGGMVPACVIARELNIRVVDSISVKSYDHQTQMDAQVLKAPDAELMADGGAGVLIVDDLVDTGRTFAKIKSEYPKAEYAAVYAKPQGKPFVQHYVTEVSQDTWIFLPWDLALQYVEPYGGTD